MQLVNLIILLLMLDFTLTCCKFEVGVHFINSYSAEASIIYSCVVYLI